MTAHVPHTDEANARFQMVAFHIHHNTSLSSGMRGHLGSPFVPDIALPHSKAHPAGLRATLQVTRLVLFGITIRRKRHKSVMSIVMNGMDLLLRRHCCHRKLVYEALAYLTLFPKEEGLLEGIHTQ